MSSEKRGYTISNLYQGSYSSLDPGKSMYGLKGNTNLAPGEIAPGALGMTTDPRTANILQEVSSKLSSGVKNIEIEAVSPEVFDSIPKQQLKEVYRLSKLTGIDVSMHAPVMNVSGIDQRGGYSESEREAAERKVANALIRAHELNPDGNIPVNFHTAEGIPGSQFLPPSQRDKEGKYKQLIVINKDTGRLAPLDAERMYYPKMTEVKPEIERKIKSGEMSEYDLRDDDGRLKRQYFENTPLEKGTYKTPEKRMEMLNDSEWDNSISQIIFNKDRVDQILDENKMIIQPILADLYSGKIEDLSQVKSPTAQEAVRRVRLAEDYMDDVYKQVNNIFSKAYEFGNPQQRNELKKLSENLNADLEKNKDPIYGKSIAMDNFIHELKKSIFTPEMYVPLEDFATEKTASTFGNAAWKAYKDLKGKNVPILTIENPPAGFGLSTGEDVRNVVLQSRQKFVQNAVKEGGMSESQAAKEAEKLIGATWDVGHINMLRKFGYSEKEIIAEAEKVAPLIKHVHLSDNFGFEHTELPMGMGNVPLKEIMEKLGKKGFEAKKIIEAAGWWQHFRTQPFQESLEAMGSPIYGMKMAPYWSQAPGLTQGYFGGYGQMLPQTHYETFGAGFSRLPTELGGQSPGAQGSRMSGRGME